MRYLYFVVFFLISMGCRSQVLDSINLDWGIRVVVSVVDQPFNVFGEYSADEIRDGEVKLKMKSEYNKWYAYNFEILKAVMSSNENKHYYDIYDLKFQGSILIDFEYFDLDGNKCFSSFYIDRFGNYMLNGDSVVYEKNDSIIDFLYSNFLFLNSSMLLKRKEGKHVQNTND